MTDKQSEVVSTTIHAEMGEYMGEIAGDGINIYRMPDKRYVALIPKEGASHIASILLSLGDSSHE